MYLHEVYVLCVEVVFVWFSFNLGLFGMFWSWFCTDMKANSTAGSATGEGRISTQTETGERVYNSNTTVVLITIIHATPTAATATTTVRTIPLTMTTTTRAATTTTQQQQQTFNVFI